jgi:dual oxidase
MVPGLYLSEEEIDEFIRDLDKNGTGHIDYDLLESRLDEVHEELVSDSKEYQSRNKDQRHAFLRSVMGTGETTRIPQEDFSNTVRHWNVPSLNPEAQTEAYHEYYMKSLPWSRRFWAYWSVQGREILFIALVVSMQVAFGVWQLVEYLTKPQYRHVGCPLPTSSGDNHSLFLRHSDGDSFFPKHVQASCTLSFSFIASFQPSDLT